MDGKRVGAALALVAALAVPTTAQAQTQPVFVNGQAQVVPAMNVSAEWIRHRLWVETEFDTDGDGKRDRMHVDVTRPAQTDTEGLKVPVIYETSPYYAGTGNTAAQYLWNVNHELGTAPPARTSPPWITFNPNRTSISTSEVGTWVPRGFAVVHSESPGTGLSQGCPTVGGTNENDGPKAVIEWLNGRAKGYTTVDGDVEVKADWSTGNVGMTGTSYNGTLPISAATTGVDGLKAIIPIAPNTSYYHYYRSNGLVRNPGGWVGEDIDFLFDYINSGNTTTRQYCIDTVREGLMKLRQDRITGDYNDFWAGRDQLNQLANVKAATLMAHAFNDWNVVPEHSVRIAEALKGKVPLQQFYHQGGHGGAPPLGLRNRWFSRYLYGVQNGVENDPKAWVTREAAACPPRTAAIVGAQSNTATLTVANSGQLQVGMTLTIPQTTGGTTANVTRTILAIPSSTTVLLDSAVATTAGQSVADGAVVSIVCSTANPTPYGDYPNPASKAVELRPRAGGNTTGALTSVGGPGAGQEKLIDDVSCQPGSFVNAGAQRLVYATPTMTAPLHLSGTPRVNVRMAASKAAANLSVWLVALPFTPSVTCTSTTINTSHVITRGWADPQNRGALTGGAPLVPGEFVDVAFNLQPTDKVVLAGQRLALMVFSSDRLFTLRPQPGTEVTVDLAGTSVAIPVVGGSKAFTTATGGDEEEAPVGATVPATLSLALGAPATFGAFTPGVAKEYMTASTANVISTAGDAALTVSDPGHLTNGTFSLPQPLQVAFSKSTWSGPTSNERVDVTFKQAIGANDALRTGTYSKTLTFTLSTTNP